MTLLDLAEYVAELINTHGPETEVRLDTPMYYNPMMYLEIVTYQFNEEEIEGRKVVILHTAEGNFHGDEKDEENEENV